MTIWLRCPRGSAGLNDGEALRWLALALLVLLVPVASCQLAISPGAEILNDVCFYVFHPQGFALANASVTVFDEYTGNTWTMYTDVSGRAVFSALPVSRYKTTIYHPLLGTSESTHVIAYDQFLFTPTMGLMSTVTCARSVMRIDVGIPFVSISLANYETGATYSSFTLGDGTVYFLNLPKGKYVATVAGSTSILSFNKFAQEYATDPSTGQVAPKKNWLFVLVLCVGLVVAGVGVFVPAILGRGISECFDVDLREVNWLGRARDFSFWRRFSSFDVFFWYFVLIVALIFYLWLMINTEYLKLGVSYSLLLLVALVGIASGESEMGLIGFGRIERYVRYLFAGIFLICLNFLVNEFSMGMVLPGETVLSVFNAFSMNSIHIIVFGPLIEEACFQMFLFPVFAQRVGMVPATVIVAFLFGFFHWQVYGAIFSILFVAAAFRAAACVMTALYMSVVPAYLAHVTNNAVSFMKMFR